MVCMCLPVQIKRIPLQNYQINADKNVYTTARTLDKEMLIVFVGNRFFLRGMFLPHPVDAALSSL